jgi:hypothetical protein
MTDSSSRNGSSPATAQETSAQEETLIHLLALFVILPIRLYMIVTQFLPLNGSAPVFNRNSRSGMNGNKTYMKPSGTVRSVMLC